jgi:hypothetical protein
MRQHATINAGSLPGSSNLNLRTVDESVQRSELRRSGREVYPPASVVLRTPFDLSTHHINPSILIIKYLQSRSVFCYKRGVPLQEACCVKSKMTSPWTRPLSANGVPTIKSGVSAVALRRRVTLVPIDTRRSTLSAVQESDTSRNNLWSLLKRLPYL